MSNVRFYECKECGLLALSFNGKEIPGLKELVPNTVDASGEKHLPVVQLEGDKLVARIGSVEHPMVPEHFIQWVYLLTDKGGQRKNLVPGSDPKVKFALGDEKPVAVYAYCNLHGLWKSDL
jgi:superoxide reductase